MFNAALLKLIGNLFLSNGKYSPREKQCSRVSGGRRGKRGGRGVVVSVSQPFVLWLRVKTVPTVGYAMTGATMETAVLVLDQAFQSRAIPDVVVLNVLKDVGLTL